MYLLFPQSCRCLWLLRSNSNHHFAAALHFSEVWRVGLLPDRKWTDWEGEAPAEPKLSAGREVGKSAGREGSE